MDEQERQRIIATRETEDNLRSEFIATLEQRVARYVDTKPHGIIPDRHFAPASTECTLLFRDGHWYGCIALVQGVAEAVVRLAHHVQFKRDTKSFENMVGKLRGKRHISEQCKTALLTIWEDRDDYHHLNADIETDRKTLEDMAKQKLCLLRDVEQEVFAFTVVEGRLKPEHPEYWDITGNGAEVFLRLEP